MVMPQTEHCKKLVNIKSNKLLIPRTNYFFKLILGQKQAGSSHFVKLFDFVTILVVTVQTRVLNYEF